MAYDEKCHDLACDFLGDHQHLNTKRRCEHLAQLIQQTIDDFIHDENVNYEPEEHGDAWSGGFAENH